MPIRRLRGAACVVRSTWRGAARPGSPADSAAGPPWLPRTGAPGAGPSCDIAVTPGWPPVGEQARGWKRRQAVAGSPRSTAGF
eukprot:7425161-Alexandrium_andersonii.AAC.1